MKEEEKLTVKDLIPQFEKIKSSQINIQKIIDKAESDNDFLTDTIEIDTAFLNAQKIIDNNKAKLLEQKSLDKLLNYLYDAYNNETHIAKYIEWIYKTKKDYKNKKIPSNIRTEAKNIRETISEFYKLANTKIKKAKEIYEKKIKTKKYLIIGRKSTKEDRLNIKEALNQTESTTEKLYNTLKKRLDKIANKNKS